LQYAEKRSASAQKMLIIFYLSTWIVASARE